MNDQARSWTNSGSVVELLLTFLKAIKNQKLVARYQHI